VFVELHGMPQAEADRISLRSLELLRASGPQLLVLRASGTQLEMDGSKECLLAPITNTGKVCTCSYNVLQLVLTYI
jgi:hypothetical protein